MMPPIEGPCPLIQVYDMPRSVGFYRMLGFEVVGCAPERRGDDFDWGLLRLDGMELMLNTAYEKPARPTAPEPGRVEHHADTGLFFYCADPDAAHRYLQSLGIEAPPPTVAPYGMKQLWLKDPDGYVICLQCPVPG